VADGSNSLILKITSTFSIFNRPRRGPVFELFVLIAQLMKTGIHTSILAIRAYASLKNRGKIDRAIVIT
jgi:hypothetical protein